MLPFLKNKVKSSGVMQVVTRKPDETAENSQKEQSDDMSDIEECTQDMISAIKASDSKALAKAINSTSRTWRISSSTLE